jgi:hypothetical protein
LMVQASPVHNMRALETLKGMAAKRGGAGAGKAEGVKALRAMVDWWVGGGGPGRKLRYTNYYTRPCCGINISQILSRSIFTASTADGCSSCAMVFRRLAQEAVLFSVADS